MNKKIVAGGTGAAMLALVLSSDITQKWEGRSLDPYQDIVGVWTVCDGETRVPMRRYTDAECDAMHQKALGGFQKEVLACTPGLKDKPYQLAAATSLAYNIGSAAYCRSTAARHFNRGDLRKGCEAFYMWRYAGKKEVRGLANRRKDEIKLCLTGL